MTDDAPPPPIAVTWRGETSLQSTAADLAARLNLPLLDAAARSSEGLTLIVAADDDAPGGYRLELHSDQKLGPLAIDFTGGAFGFRRRQPQHLRGELIARAVGFKGQPLNILDATAGLGRDSVILALLGNHVTAVEQHPVIHALLADGLRRAIESDHALLAAALRDHLRLLHGDAAHLLATMPDEQKRALDVIYLDPMFPPRTKSALVKKEMRLLSRLAVHDEAADLRLLTAARATGVHRIVIKRPPHAPPLDPSLNYTPFSAPAARFDVLFQV